MINPIPSTTTSRWSPATALLAAALVATGAPLAAQQTDTIFSEEIEVKVVNVEVVVTDKAGQPISDLTMEDFEVLEDGKPVQLTNFYAVDNAGASLGAGQMPEAGDESAEPARPAGSTQRLHLVIYVDNLNIRPENRKHLFEKLRTHLREQGALPGTRAMLVAMNQRLEVVVPFTDDLTKIDAALDEIERRTSYYALLDMERRRLMHELARANLKSIPCHRNRPDPTASTDLVFDEAVRTAQRLAMDVNSIGEQRYQVSRGTVQSLAAFTDTLAGLPGRKALLYLSDGISMRPTESLNAAWLAKYEQWFQRSEKAIRNCSRFPEAASDLLRAASMAGTNQTDMHSDFNRLTDRASDNRVAFYPISNSGRGAGMGSAEIPGSLDGTSGQLWRDAMVTEAISRDAALLQMAEDTGGEALTRTANIGELLDRVGRDFSTFYSLGYAPPDRNKDTQFHKIKVKVRRDGAKVRHVEGYTDKTWRDRLGDMTTAAALYEIEANPLGVQLQRGETVPLGGGRLKIPILVQIPFRDLQMVSDGEKYTASLSILVVVRDDENGFSKPRRFDLPIQVPNAQILQARQQAAAYPVELELKKNARVAAIGVRDHVARSASVVKLDLGLGGDDDGKAKKGKKRKKKKKKTKKT
ncbi:MAG: VWA domain-containing protein [bacterium]|nr:VWA domain-containing protein [bacterium]